MARHLLSTVTLVTLGLALLLQYSLRRTKYAHPSRTGRAGLAIGRPLYKGLAALHTDTVSGTICCAGIASFLCLLLKDSRLESLVPILFLLVVLGVVARWGAVAGSLGTVVAALIFAEFLFEPRYSLAVNNVGERMNLAWMVLGGLVISNFFGDPKSH
jgi:K+-sensing histidine kinase KdpD